MALNGCGHLENFSALYQGTGGDRHLATRARPPLPINDHFLPHFSILHASRGPGTSLYSCPLNPSYLISGKQVFGYSSNSFLHQRVFSTNRSLMGFLYSLLRIFLLHNIVFQPSNYGVCWFIKTTTSITANKQTNTFPSQTRLPRKGKSIRFLAFFNLTSL